MISYRAAARTSGAGIVRRVLQGALRVTPADALARHLDDRSFIEAELSKPFDRPTVVVTHHVPHPGSVAERFANDALTPAFVSDLSEVIDRYAPALWIHSHTHDLFDYRVDATRIVCNPKGYRPIRPRRRIDNVAFDVGRVIEV